MTEPKIAELYEGIHAHAQGLGSLAGDAKEDAGKIADAAKEAASIAKELSDLSLSLTTARLGHYAEIGRKMAQRATRMSMNLTRASDRQNVRAVQLGCALEGLVRLADGTQQETDPQIPMNVLAAAEAGLCPACGRPTVDHDEGA